MTFVIPSKESKRFSVDNTSDLFGNIRRTRNLNFNKNGYLSLARKPYVWYTEVDDVDYETPIAILSDDDYYYSITTGETFRFDARNSGITVSKLTDGTSPSNGFQSDGVFFNGELYQSGGTTICSLTGTTWTQDITGLSSSYPHPLCVSEHQQYLAVGNGNTVRLYSTAHALITTLTIPSDHVVTWIRWRANLLWVGTRNIQGGEAKVFLWNGSGTSAQSGYGVGAEWAFSGCNYDFEGTIVVISASGLWLKFNGSGFVPLRDSSGKEVAFPIYYMDSTWGSSAATFNLLGKVASRGMEARGGKIYALVDSTSEFNSGGTPENYPNFPGGLWCFDPAVGLYHKAGVCSRKYKNLSFSSLTDNTLTLASAQVYETCDPVEITSIGLLTGDIDTILYYAIKVSSTQIKLALTPQQALASDAITITGAVAGAVILMNSYESTGGAPSRAGGVCVVKAAGLPRFTGNEVVYGCEVDLTYGTSIGAIMSMGMGKNVGSFMTPKLQASAVTDTFSKIVSKFSYFNVPSQKLLIKYRTKKRWGLPGRQGVDGNENIVWVTSTTFLVNPKQYDMYSVQVGDEVEIIRGAAAGYTAHIESITVDSSTQWTIAIDEAMPDVVASDSSLILIDNFTKLVTVSSASSDPDAQIASSLGFLKKAIGGDSADDKNKSKQIELKLELRGYTDIEETIDFEEVMLVNTADQNYA